MREDDVDIRDTYMYTKLELPTYLPISASGRVPM